MPRFVNRPDTMVAESLEGFVAAHGDLVRFCPSRQSIRRLHLTPGKVALISGGGAGHEPLHIGFVGTGMLDAACTGQIFTSPTPDQIVAAIEETDTGSGCLLIVKNYDGDVMNFEMAAEIAGDRHDIRVLFVGDDVSGHPGYGEDRRGVAGTLIVEKLLGAAAERGASLDALHALGTALMPRISTMGVALNGAHVPDLNRQSFSLRPDEIEIGVGIHGEPGRARQAYAGAGDAVRLICTEILAAQDRSRTDGALLFVNGLGATSPAELYLTYGLARRQFEADGIRIIRTLVGTYVTSLDMSGVSITLAQLDDAVLDLWDAPVRTGVLNWG
nr:dihydroxyacetone kinase subunit DhaK [uncultured Gellertiella sp.]